MLNVHAALWTVQFLEKIALLLQWSIGHKIKLALPQKESREIWCHLEYPRVSTARFYINISDKHSLWSRLWSNPSGKIMGPIVTLKDINQIANNMLHAEEIDGYIQSKLHDKI